MKSVLSVLVLGLGVTGALGANFISSCDEKSVNINGRTLTANCKNIFGQLKCSKLDLNRCLMNNYGRLQEDPTGAGREEQLWLTTLTDKPHIGNQCIKCTNGKADNGLIVDAPPSLKYCQCNPGTGAVQAIWPTAIFDLNTLVDNNNGVLECYKTKATPC
ncbi:hypothetical protein N658DRAFT_508142 [Parathielavia hyrcaniae]|uniref:Cyanovirin-N domain-containing protein n=1 Tax=Parathielavia hyrcaniae TaxID=113614 RepID=A0AAN6Q0T1_9PEZI|nr:hypothetical protein N658DRAFT_508142 [Parathielavia hyrcaniae]